DNGDGTMTYTDEDGVATVINLSTAVAATETLTSLVDNGNGTFTYTSENGTVTTFDANGLSVSNVIAGHLIATVTEANGTSVAIDETVTTVNDIVGGTGHTIASYTNEDGVVTNINETVTTFVDNGDGTYTYTNENGIPTTTAAASNTNIYSVDGTLTGDRVVAYSDNDLTFDIGGNNGRFILNGTFQKDGAVYYSYRVESGATVTWLDKDYVVIFTNLGIDGNLTFPSAALYPGRVLKLANDTASALTFGGIPGDTAPLNVSNIPSRTASEYISTGTDWVRITGR
ncbi:hypothetical protein NHF50_10105, partial [Flavobacterium sp. NRK F10]|nr:hypothetical protein [Flavobacterium sp. NRK F10]